MNFIYKIFPILNALKGYSGKFFLSDLVAGLTVATILIPQGMAYALLAGVPPIYGLYAGIVPLLIYSLFGTSRQMSIGPVAVSSLLVLSGVSVLATPESPEFISLAITAALMIGVLQIILSFLKLGFLANFISRPVITGFTSAAAIIILGSQLKDALGITMPRFETVAEYFIYTFQHLQESNWITELLCFGGIAVMVLLKKIHRSIPGALIIVIIGTIITYVFKLERNGIELVREIPQGLPKFIVPNLDLNKMQALLPTVLTVTIINIVETISIAKVLEAKHRNYSINANQELFAIGIAKVISSFFQSIPTSASFTRSAINSNSGAKTTISSIITAIMMALSLIFLTPLFYFLPKAILAAIILVAVIGLLDIKEAIHLWRTHKGDFSMMIITFVATLILGIEEGVLFGVVLSILLVLYRSSKPHLAVLGRIPGTNYYRNVGRFEDAEEFEHTLIIRFDEQLYFANAVYFKDKVNLLMSDPKYANIKYLVLDASNIHNIDSTGSHMISDLNRDLQDKGIEFHLSGVTGPVRDMLFKCELMKNPLLHHMSVQDAVNQIHSNKEDIELRKRTLQTNVKNF